MAGNGTTQAGAAPARPDPEGSLIISNAAAQEILNYLVKRPFDEVWRYVQALTNLQAYKQADTVAPSVATTTTGMRGARGGRGVPPLEDIAD